MTACPKNEVLTSSFENEMESLKKSPEAFDSFNSLLHTCLLLSLLTVFLSVASSIHANQRGNPCDLQNVCEENGLPRLRNYEQIWLFMSPKFNARKNRQEALRKAKEDTFVGTNSFVTESKAWVNRYRSMTAKVILQIRSGLLPSSTLVILDTTPPDVPVNHFHLSKEERMVNECRLFKHSTSFTPSYRPSCKGSISVTRLHARATDFTLAKIGLTDLLISLTKLVSLLAEELCLKLRVGLRPSKTRPISQENHVVLRLYHQVLVHYPTYKGTSLSRHYSHPSTAQSMIEHLLKKHISRGLSQKYPLCLPQVLFGWRCTSVLGQQKSISKVHQLQVYLFDVPSITNVAQLLMRSSPVISPLRSDKRL
ncbi:hypothetical protein PABG_11689 [Paracoccidioides brasiliensis Pb03]|nr:hypothetical protein PABG_11689 [Paracoccidioides brasiliensis Pb03]